jgi:hypothetical protein
MFISLEPFNPKIKKIPYPIVIPFELYKFMVDSKRPCTLWHTQSEWINISSLYLQRQHNLISTFLIWNKNGIVVKI